MAATSELFDHVVFFIRNPITRTVVKIVPPAEIMSQGEYDALVGKFEVFCEIAWRKEGKDPEIVDPRVFRAWGEEPPQ